MEPAYFEELEIGPVRRAGPYRLCEREMIEFAREWDPEPFPADPEAAARSVFGGITASSAHLFAVSVRLSHALPRRMAVLGGLGNDAMEFLRPARPGDELTIEVECTHKRESQSKPDRGVLTTETRILDQKGRLVMRYRSTLLVLRRPSGGF